MTNDNMVDDIIAAIQGLPAKNAENRYSVVSLPSMNHKIGCSEEGYPKFFIETSEHSALLHNLNAELLSVEYNMLCSIVENDSIIDNACFTIITLRSEDEQLQRVFLDVFIMMLKTLPEKPANTMVASKIESLLSIFAKLKKKPIHMLQGLWAELLVIENSKNPSLVAQAWHSQPDSKYDFTKGSEKIEVKSTSSENRVHRFSLDQLNPTKNSHLLICSVIVRESAPDTNGLSVFDLYNRICRVVTEDEIRMHLNDVIIDTLGSDFFSAKKKCFDYTAACDSQSFFEYKEIPRIAKEDVPEHVSDVKFCADLSHLKDVRELGINYSESLLFSAVL